MQPTSRDGLSSDPLPCGVYRVPLGYLQSRIDQSALQDLQWHLFPHLEAVTRESLLTALSETLSFPDYFGHNWDAAWDCLSEQVWPSGQLHILHLRIEADAFLAETDVQTFVELMDDACQHWAAQNTVCYVLIEADRHDSKTINELKRIRFFQ